MRRAFLAGALLGAAVAIAAAREAIRIMEDEEKAREQS
jgi:hypothetical protein